MSKLGSSDNPLKVAIVGAGPSGFYAADALINSELKVEVNLIEKFSEERFQYFAECLVYEESPESLPKDIYNKIHRSFAQRLLSTNKEKWETTSSFFSEVDTLRETKYKDKPEMLKVLEGYNKHVMEIQTKFENA